MTAVPARASRFGEPDESSLPDDIRAIYEANRAKIGFVPNVFRAYAKRPEHFRAFMQYHDVLMRGPSGLTRAEREALGALGAVGPRRQLRGPHNRSADSSLGRSPLIPDNRWK